MPSKCVLACLALALIGVGGCLYLSFGAGLVACPLCIYQRAFLMAAFAVAAIGAVAGRGIAGLVCAMILPIAVMGLGVAGFHEYLIRTAVIECPPGLLSLGSLPTQSLVLFALMAALAATGLLKSHPDSLPRRAQMFVLGIAIGIAVAWASVASAPPIPQRKSPYDPTKDIFNNCRPVYKASATS